MLRNVLLMVTKYLTFAFLFFITDTSYASLPLNANLTTMLQNVMPAIVNIRANVKITDFNTLREIQQERGEDPGKSDTPLPDTFTSIGSGVIVDAKEGLILTNAHVVNNAQIITVSLSDNRHYTAKLIGIDKPSDIALLQIKAKNLKAVTIGDSAKVKVGDFVAAIGNPFGLNQTATSGIVSATGRNSLGIESYENFIQTDAPINPGNSGGALVDMDGNLIGINTALLGPNRGSIGIGFAIPSNMAKSVMQQLIQYGNVKRGQLGISAQNVSPELADAFNLDGTKGALVTEVLTDSPAQMSGIKVGDIITNVNGNVINNAGDVVNTIGFLRVDTKTTLNVIREGKPVNITVTLSDPKVRQKLISANDPFFYGVGLKDFSLQSPLHGKIEGVVVISVDTDSNAFQADLRPGDVIVSANQQSVKNTNDLKTALSKANKTLLLNILRGPGALFLVINKE